jgi:xanthine/uracil permease
MVPVFAPAMLTGLPGWFAPFAQSGITLAALAAVGLNLLFNRAPTR